MGGEEEKNEKKSNVDNAWGIKGRKGLMMVPRFQGNQGERE